MFRTIDRYIRPLRCEGSTTGHAAALTIDWQGRALCGIEPGRSRLWALADVVNCEPCRRRIPAETVVEWTPAAIVASLS